ncbi:ATP-binding protein [Desulfobacterales bacterium HSG17]|nr:ATP-binding protein [Desulfobacterales bacterium HSG17]
MNINNRILVIDDDPGVRESYREILIPVTETNLLAQGASLFGETGPAIVKKKQKQYDLILASNGEQGIARVKEAIEKQAPFAAAFVDMKMPGFDGAETSKRIWEIDPDIKIVIVTAFSEYTPDDIIRITDRDDIFYLRKPFNYEEIRQFARAFTNQWNLEQEKALLTRKLKNANAELADMNENLQLKVKEQTTQLVQSEKMAAIGILAAGVAHEINNPVSFINGNLSAMKKYCLRIKDLLKKYKKLEKAISGSEKHDRVQSLLDDINLLKKKHKINFILEDLDDLANESLEGTMRINNIVKDLKTFSRIDQDAPEHVNLNDTMDTTLNIIRNELKYKVEIIKNYGKLPMVRCFSRKISQVFMNILINAGQSIKEQGQIIIKTRHIEAAPQSEDSHVEITISDTGSGIPLEDISKIFNPFFTTKPVGQGTGLGLSISYDIIKTHGGDIKIETRKEKGTTFIINLPVSIL